MRKVIALAACRAASFGGGHQLLSDYGESIMDKAIEARKSMNEIASVRSHSMIWSSKASGSSFASASKGEFKLARR